MDIPQDAHSSFSDAIESGDLQQVERWVRKHPTLVNHPNWTPPPLHCAVLWNQAAVAELLLNHGANMELRDPDRNTTALRYAIMYCKTDVIPLLLSRGAQTSPIDTDGASAFELAKEAAAGAYEQYQDLPKKEEYAKVVPVLTELGLTE